MVNLSVAEAAKRIGVSVPRIHQRIADGSVRAERVGSQWIIDEASLLQVAERNAPGRPPSPRSAWALVALAEGDEDALKALAPSERARAQLRLKVLLENALLPLKSEDDLRGHAAALRFLLRHRGRRLAYRASPADLVDLRADRRWQALVSPADSGIASNDVDGYLAAADVEKMAEDFLLAPSPDRDANVVIHVLPAGQEAYPDSRLRLAADLAEQREPRAELRAAQLLRELAEQLVNGQHA